jgi:hypothetical protein
MRVEVMRAGDCKYKSMIRTLQRPRGSVPNQSHDAGVECLAPTQRAGIVLVSKIKRVLVVVGIATFPISSLQSQASPTAITAEQWRADLRFLMDQMRLQHKNMYHSTSAATFDSVASALDARIPTLARHEIIAEMMKIVALVGDGHTNIYPTRDKVIGFHTLPVALYRFKDGWFIRAADSAHADLVGGRLSRVGAVPIDEAYERIKPYAGRDNEMGAMFWAGYLLAMPEMLNAAGLSPNADSARFEIELEGKRRSVWLKSSGVVPSTPADTDFSWWRRAGWVDARDNSRSGDPIWLSRRPDSTLWWLEKLPGTKIGYAQINQVRNGDKESFESFTDRLLQFADTAGLDKLILDLRLNRGGNGELLKPLERGLLRRPQVNSRGKLYVIMGRSTWSAAQFFLNDMLEFSDAIFVGEPSGSRGNSYGDSRQIKLPNSGITARVSIYYWQDWHPLDTRPWVAPEIASAMTFSDYESDRDPALAAAISDAGGQTMTKQLQSLVANDDTVSARAKFSAFRTAPEHVYVDGHSILDAAALHFYNGKDIPRATWVFALAAEQYPEALRAHLNLAAMYQEAGKRELEVGALRRAIELDPSSNAARARLKALGVMQ